MQTARRLYVYLLSGIALGTLVVGLSMLLTVLLDTLGLRGTEGVMFGGPDATGQQLTLASALTVVSLPLWLAHWIAAERSVAPGRAGADLERSSDVRGLYFAVAMGALLLVAAFAARALIEWLVFAVVGDANNFMASNPAGDLALLLVAGAAWGYHVALRTRDWRHGQIRDAGAFLPRTYLYLATFIGLMAMLFGIVGLVELTGRVLLDEPGVEFGGQGNWWAYPLASSIAGVVVGGTVWVGHWAFAGRLLADTGWRGASERTSRVRLAYYVAVIVVTAAVAVGQLAASAAAALRAAFGISEALEAGQVAGLIVLPLIGAVIFGLACELHRRWLAGESETTGVAGRVHTSGRLEEYGTALVGLAFAGTGVAMLIGVTISTVLTAGRTLGGTDSLLHELSNSIPMAIFGAALWIWSWRRASARFASAPAEEAGATSRRAALLIVVAVSLLTGVGSLGFILYRVFGAAFGVALGGDVAAELSQPSGALIVALVAGLYHATLLRRDQALRARAEPEAVPATGPEAAAPPSSVVLRLIGPSGADLSAATASMRDSLPPDYSLEPVPSEPG
ncbi:MAG TPA: DUF5671 domain-containing protein [Candidatus Binatia bacterium]|nr:DUF5671 domain-containing protein [Candidatus Binatia bacterium]